MLADDDEDDAMIFCEALTFAVPDTECQTAISGFKLFETLLNAVNKPDIIFLDINMPVMDGWECLKRLKANSAYSNIPVIMYSTSSSRKDIEMAYSLGAKLFLTKPEDFRELSSILKVVALGLPDFQLSLLSSFNSVKAN